MGRMNRCTPLAAALAASIGAHPAVAQKKDDAIADGPQRCIALPNLESTDVLDNRTILFHMRNGRIYLNHLSRECPGLAREKRFMYSPTSSQLCEIDAVTVIEKWGFGFTRGFTCSLGEFHPLSQAEFESLVGPVQTRNTGDAKTDTNANTEAAARADAPAKNAAKNDARAKTDAKAAEAEQSATGSKDTGTQSPPSGALSLRPSESANPTRRNSPPQGQR